MFVLHGKGVVAGFKPFTPPLGAGLEAGGNEFLPFPPIQSVSVSIPSGIQNIYQLGVNPLRDIVNLSINPTDVSFSFILSQDYPYYPQLLSAIAKSALTNHYPINDFRIYLGKTFLDGKYTVVDLVGCVVRRVTFNFRDGVATFSLSFAVSTGVIYLADNAGAIPPALAMTHPPATKVNTICRITNPQGGTSDFMQSPTAYSVLSASIDVTINTRHIHTLPTLSHAFGFSSSPLLPTAIPATLQEGTETYSGEITIALPPTTPQPPVATVPGVYAITLTTSGGLVVSLLDAKVGGASPSISATSAITFSLTFQGQRVIFGAT